MANCVACGNDNATLHPVTNPMRPDEKMHVCEVCLKLCAVAYEEIA